MSGDWSYVSGLLHSEWIHTGAIVHENGTPRIDLRTRNPEARIFIIPVEQAELKRDWNVLGLRATGSIDYSIRNVSVPEEFTHLLTANRPNLGGDLYRVGILGFAAIGHTGFTLGVARRTLDEIAALANSPSPRPSPLRAAATVFRCSMAEPKANFAPRGHLHKKRGTTSLKPWPPAMIRQCGNSRLRGLLLVMSIR